MFQSFCLFLNFIASTDTHRRSDYTKSNEQNYNERIDRILFTPTRAFDRSLTHRDSLSNYDPSKSPLFVDKNPVCIFFLMLTNRNLTHGFSIHRNQLKQQQISHQMNFQLIIY